MADSQRKSYNLCDLSSWTNQNTDTRSYFQIVVLFMNDNTQLGKTSNIDVRTTGEKAISFNVSYANCNKLQIKHNGSTRDLFITNILGEFSGDYTLSFDCLGTNPTAIDGIQLDKIMLNTGTTAKPYEPYGWVHSLRKLTTATEAVENPLYSDGTAITAYTIKGNTVQDGTPTPSNPIAVEGVGNKTANLSLVTQDNAITYSSNFNKYAIANNVITCTGNAYMGFIVKVNPNTAYTVQGDADELGIRMRVMEFSAKPVDFSTNLIQMSYDMYMSISKTGTITTTATTEYVLLAFYNDKPTNRIFDIMMSEGSTVPNYEPYGYKIPISSGGVTTPIYLSQQLINLETVEIADTLASSGTATYNTYKLVLTGNESWYDDALPKGDTYSYRMIAPYIYDVGNVVGYDAICTHFDVGAYYAASVVGVQHSSRNLYFRNTETTLENWKQWLADQYAAGTPVTIYYRVATPTTESVTAPSIPTTEGANSITVDTTVQPSEFTATWTGWHDAYVKEKSENLFDEAFAGLTTSLIYFPIYVGNGTFTLSTTTPINPNDAASLFFLAGNVSTGASTQYNGVWDGVSRTVTSSSGYVTIAYRYNEGVYVNPKLYDTMLNEGSTAQTYEPYWK